MKKHSIALEAELNRTNDLRMALLESRSDPKNGATTENGAIVITRYNITCDLAAVGEIEKNRDPAKDTVTSVSPADTNMCNKASFPKGLFWSNRSAKAFLAID